MFSQKPSGRRSTERCTGVTSCVIRPILLHSTSLLTLPWPAPGDVESTRRPAPGWRNLRGDWPSIIMPIYAAVRAHRRCTQPAGDSTAALIILPVHRFCLFVSTCRYCYSSWSASRRRQHSLFLQVVPRHRCSSYFLVSRVLHRSVRATTSRSSDLEVITEDARRNR